MNSAYLRAVLGVYQARIFKEHPSIWVWLGAGNGLTNANGGHSSTRAASFFGLSRTALNELCLVISASPDQLRNCIHTLYVGTCNSVIVSGIGEYDGTYDYASSFYYTRAGGTLTYEIQFSAGFWYIESLPLTIVPQYRVSRRGIQQPSVPLAAPVLIISRPLCMQLRASETLSQPSP